MHSIERQTVLDGLMLEADALAKFADIVAKAVVLAPGSSVDPKDALGPPARRRSVGCDAITGPGTIPGCEEGSR